MRPQIQKRTHKIHDKYIVYKKKIIIIKHESTKEQLMKNVIVGWLYTREKTIYSLVDLGSQGDDCTARLLIKCPIGWSSSGQNMIKCPLPCPFSGENEMKRPLGCTSSVENMIQRTVPHSSRNTPPYAPARQFALIMPLQLKFPSVVLFLFVSARWCPTAYSLFISSPLSLKQLESATESSVYSFEKKKTLYQM